MPDSWSHAKLVSQNVYRLRNGRWGVRVYETRDGRQRNRRFSFLDRRAAEAFARAWSEARAYISAGLKPPVIPEPERRRTVADILDAYLAELATTGRSEAQVEIVTRVRGLVCGRRLKSGAYVTGALGSEHPVPLSREDLVRIAEHVKLHTRSGGYATRRAYVVLRTAHRRAELVFPTPPAVNVERRGRAILPLEQLVAFLEAMPLGSVERTAAELVLRTGAREAEVLRLRREDVDLESGRVLLAARKRGLKLPARPISPGLAAVLQPYLATLPHIAPAGTPLLTIEGRPLAAGSLRKRLAAASQRAGLAKPIGGLGWLRNQTATLAIEAGLPVEVARRALGHETSSTTERHYDRAELWPALERFAAVIDQQLAGGGVPRTLRPKKQRRKGA